MKIITTSVENFGHTMSHAWESCTAAVTESCRNIGDAYETGRQRVVHIAQEKLSPQIAYIVERISLAVPEVFVALAALWGRFLTLPAMLLSYGRMIEPLLPVIQTVLRGDMSAKGLGDSLRNTLDNFERIFEKVGVPAIFVACLVDTVFSVAVGWLAHDWGRFLHGTAIALPGLWVSLQYMLYQHRKEQHLELPSAPSLQ